MYGGFVVGVSIEGLKNAPGIDGRKEEKGRATERARLTDFDGPGVGVEGGPEGRGKATAMGPVASWGESVVKVFTDMGNLATLSGCVCEDGDGEVDCTSSVGAEGLVGGSRDSTEPDRGESRFVRIFGDFLRGRCVECREVSWAGRDEDCTTTSVR